MPTPITANRDRVAHSGTPSARLKASDPTPVAEQIAQTLRDSSVTLPDGSFRPIGHTAEALSRWSGVNDTHAATQVLAELADAGLVHDRLSGATSIYSLAEEALEVIGSGARPTDGPDTFA
jgi:hypothetical protein